MASKFVLDMLCYWANHIYPHFICLVLEVRRSVKLSVIGSHAFVHTSDVRPWERKGLLRSHIGPNSKTLGSYLLMVQDWFFWVVLVMTSHNKELSRDIGSETKMWNPGTISRIRTEPALMPTWEKKFNRYFSEFIKCFALSSTLMFLYMKNKYNLYLTRIINK